jgi:hypothetical protein
MNIKHRLLTAATLAFAITLSSCNDDDDKGGGQLSKGDAQAKLSQFNSDATSDLQELADANGLEAMQDFFDLTSIDDPLDGGRIASDKNKFRAFLRDKGREFRSVFAPAASVKGRTNGEEPFDFDNNTGTYAWDSELQEFVYQGDAGSVIILFPTEGSTTNNAKLQITAYDEQLVEDEWGDSYYEPTVINASLFVNEVKQAELDLNIDYDDAGFPLSADIEVMVTPFTASLTFDVSNSTSSTISFSLLNNQQTVIATSVTVKYADASKSEESLSSLEGFVQFKNLKLQGTIDAEGANGEEVDFNDFVKLALYADNAKIGDIVFVTENEQAIPYVKYADGSQEKLEVVLQPVVDEIEALGESLDNNG